MTGSIVRGCVDSLGGGFKLNENLVVTNVFYNPNNYLTCSTTLGVAYDVNTGSLWGCATQNGSTWYSLGSVS